MLNLRRSLAVVVTALALIVPVLHATPAGASPGEFTSKINTLRASKGLGSLSSNGSLAAQAQRWAETMASRNAISHNPALGSTPGNWTKVGENVGTGGSVDSIFNALVNSPGHYRNMVDGKFNSVGVGVAKGSDGRIYTAHVFASFSGAGGGGSASTSGGGAKKSGGSAAVSPKQNNNAPAAKAPGNPAPKASNGGPSNKQSAGAPVADSPSQGAPVAAPAPPPPAAQIVSGLGEVAAIHLQG